jgi:hypothetical protein
MIYLQCEKRAKQSLEGLLPLPEVSHYSMHRLSLEKRAKSRSPLPLRGRVWGIDINDEAFCLDCEVANLSSGGAYLTLRREMAFSSVISLAVHLKGADGNVTAAIKGTVVRVESRSDRKYGIAVKTTRYSFL